MEKVAGAGGISEQMMYGEQPGHSQLKKVCMPDEGQIAISDPRWSSPLVRAIQIFRDLDPDISANQIAAFLMIAREPGISQAQLADKSHLNLNGGTVARICAVLSERGNRGTPGKGWVEIGKSTTDYRVTVQRLSKKGLRVLEKLRTSLVD